MSKSNTEKQFPELVETILPFTFTDCEGEEFRAKADSQLMLLDGKPCYIEIKGAELNSKKSIRTSYNKLQDVCRHFGIVDPSLNHSELSGELWKRGKYQMCLLHAWNHSRYKIKAVADQLEEQGITLLLATNQTQVHEHYGRRRLFKDHYSEVVGVEAISLQELRELIDSGRLTEAPNSASKASSRVRPIIPPTRHKKPLESQIERSEGCYAALG